MAWGCSTSPDGRWIAYSSDRTGRLEIWVMRRDGSTPARPVSRDGGNWPRWGRGGSELYFLSPRGEVMVSRVVAQGPPATPTILFTLRDWTGDQYDGGAGTLFDVAPDGERFFIASRLGEPAHLVVIQNGLR